MSSFTNCKYSFVVNEFLIIILKRAHPLSKTQHSKHFIKSNAGKTRTNIHHDDDDDETRGRGCRACCATSDGDVYHLASSFFFFFFFFFVVVFDDDFRPHSGEFKRQDGIPIVVTIEKRNDAKRK